MSNNSLLARQAIYTVDNELHGFELFYRNHAGQALQEKSGHLITAELLLNLCTSALEEDFSTNRPIFINIEEEFILTEPFFPGMSKNVIFEILETVPASDTVINTIRKLKRKGYQFALDNYVFEPERAAFLPLMSVAKVDVKKVSLAILKEQLDGLANAGITMLADKVENQETYQQCVEFGFDLFQGYYFEQPTIVSGKKISSSKMVVVKLISELCRKDITVDEISELLACDPRLIFKMLKIVNCPLFPFRREIENIKEAVIMLGIETIKKWAMMLTMTSESEQPSELFRTLLARAKICEICAEKLGKDSPADYFTVGLFSGLEAVLGISLTSILKEIHLAEPLKKELLHDTSESGGLLLAVTAFERNNKKILNMLDENLFSQVNDSYWEGIKWADEQMFFLN